jgi:hypothetical protein
MSINDMRLFRRGGPPLKICHVSPCRRLAAVLSLLGIIALLIACGGIGDKPATTSTVKLNEKLVFNDCTWVVLEARDMGKSLKPADSKDPDRTTEGRFLFVRFTVFNISKQGLSLGNPPVLMDNQDRTLGPLDEPARYLPKDVQTEDISGEIPVGGTHQFLAFYEVPADAKGLRLNKRLFQEGGFVELGL